MACKAIFLYIMSIFIIKFKRAHSVRLNAEMFSRADTVTTPHNVRFSQGFAGATFRGAENPSGINDASRRLFLILIKNIDIIITFFGYTLHIQFFSHFERTLKIECIHDVLVILTIFNFFITLNTCLLN